MPGYINKPLPKEMRHTKQSLEIAMKFMGNQPRNNGKRRVLLTGFWQLVVGNKDRQPRRISDQEGQDASFNLSFAVVRQDSCNDLMLLQVLI